MNTTYSNKMKGLGVSFKPTIDPPSIPSPSLSYGYEYVNQTNIRRQAPPRADKTMGPAYYSPKVMKKSGLSSQWSKRSGSRNIDENPQFKLNYATPGPQHYEIEPTTEDPYYDTKGRFLTQPRFKGTRFFLILK